MLKLPCAKINLGLNVVRRRSDGYHDIETVFYPIPLTDVLELRPLPEGDAPDIQILGMPQGEAAADNLVCRVYRDLQREFSLPPVSLYLYKKIPVGAGLGGGSSDAADTLVAANEMFNLGLTPSEMQSRIARYGADCAFFIRRRPVFATGIGDVFEDICLSLKGYHLALVKPAESVSTREAYAGIVPSPAETDIRQVLQGDPASWRTQLKNDFEPSVFAAHPRIAAIKQTLYDMGALYASMSGSGSAVFGIFQRPVPELQSVFADCFTFTKQLAK